MQVLCHCCKFSVGAALNVWCTTNGMCPKNNTHIYVWHEQAVIEWLRSMISVVACCHSMKLCTHAARAFRSQQNGAVTRMCRSCQVQPSQTNVRSVRFVAKRRGCCCNFSVGVALNVQFTTNGMCAKNNTHILYMWLEQAISLTCRTHPWDIFDCVFFSELLLLKGIVFNYITTLMFVLIVINVSSTRHHHHEVEL